MQQQAANMVQSSVGARALNLSVFLFFFFFFFFFHVMANAATGGAAAADHDIRAPGGFSLELIRRDSSANLTHEERWKRILEHSDARVQWLASSLNVTAIRPPMYQRSSYMVLLRIGTGAAQQDYYLELDTGSALTWTQCVPSNPSFRQEGRLFDPRSSPTYRRVACNDVLCKPPTYSCVENYCQFEAEYDDLSHIKGKFSRETFGFQSAGGRPGAYEYVEQLPFGCSHASRMNHGNGKAAGILGMNGGRESFAVQLQHAGVTDGRFSYCLTPLGFQGHSGYLRFGRDIVMRGPVQRTPMQIPPSGDYFLNLLDVSVANTRVNLDPAVFARRGESGGVVIDSDSGVSYMITPAFNQVKRALLTYFGRYRMAPVRPDLGTCFPLRRGATDMVPSLTFHLQGANLDVGGIQMFHTLRREQVICWTLRVHASMTVIGAAQQVNKRFTYDLGRSELFFAPEDCSQETRKVN